MQVQCVTETVSRYAPRGKSWLNSPMGAPGEHLPWESRARVSEGEQARDALQRSSARFFSPQPAYTETLAWVARGRAPEASFRPDETFANEARFFSPQPSRLEYLPWATRARAPQAEFAEGAHRPGAARFLGNQPGYAETVVWRHPPGPALFGEAPGTAQRGWFAPETAVVQIVEQMGWFARSRQAEAFLAPGAANPGPGRFFGPQPAYGEALAFLRGRPAPAEAAFGLAAVCRDWRQHFEAIIFSPSPGSGWVAWAVIYTPGAAAARASSPGAARAKTYAPGAARGKVSG